MGFLLFGLLRRQFLLSCTCGFTLRICSFCTKPQKSTQWTFLFPFSSKYILRRAYCEGREVLTLPESLQFLTAYNIPTFGDFGGENRRGSRGFVLEAWVSVVMKALSPQFTPQIRSQRRHPKRLFPPASSDVF
jgi:hypothetical protein